MNILKYAAAYRCGEKVADSEQEETMDIEADDLPGQPETGRAVTERTVDDGETLRLSIPLKYDIFVPVSTEST